MPLKRWAAAVAALLALLLPARADAPRGTVRLVVLDEFPPALLDVVAEGVGTELDVRTTPPAVLPMPKQAWYPPRSRWRADRLLDLLPRLVAPDGLPPGEHVLGLTTKDISTTKGPYPDWGVFGLGELPGDAAVISSFRLAKKADPALLAHRVRVTAIHEVGHMLGLPHCTEAGCVMQDAEGGIRNTDTSTGHLGPGCRALLEQLTRQP